MNKNNNDNNQQNLRVQSQVLYSNDKLKITAV